MKGTGMNRLKWMAFVLAVLGPVAMAAQVQHPDPLMGDWKGYYETIYGEGGNFVAQVIPLGDNLYRMNVLEEFDTRQEPMFVLHVERDGEKVRFRATEGGEITGSGVLKNDRLTGQWQSDDSGKFQMERVVRLSPTLGAKPPKGAVVLFDGSGFDKWKRIGGVKGLIDLAEIVGGDNAAAYLKTRIWSTGDRKAVLEIGSDDGVKVWLNGKVVHANNAARGVQPGQDKVNVDLRQGWNTLMLKVVNGAGGWGATARIADEQGKALDTVYETPFKGDPWSTTREYLEDNDGFLTVWSVAGPFRQEGKDGAGLFDVPLGPEKDGQEVDWKRFKVGGKDAEEVTWKIVDGAAIVGPSSIVTKDKFTDYDMHIEFRSPFEPKDRGQGRGNSGVYMQGRYEIQVLDSYGLEGADNECGGIYQVSRPRVNMCAPPMQWQTYDIKFRAPRFDDQGVKREPARLTLVHNGVTIHEDLALPGPTGGALDGNVRQPGGIYLQDHGDKVQFRNIWLVERPGASK